MEYKLNAQKAARLKTVTDAVLREVRPSPKESRELSSKINVVMGRLKKLAPKGVEIMVAGSSARGTNLRGDSDIDIFLLFNNPVSKDKMEEVDIGIARRLVKGKSGESYIVKYAEHPYARLFLDSLGLRVDLVPAYKISSASERITSVDRTQLHNEFVKSSLSQRQQDDVRILKALLKFHGIYGAEAKTEGFSGYLCELLTYQYGSFQKLIAAMANTKVPLVINLSNVKHDPALLAKSFGKKIVVIDPTDEKRNVAANVSDESFARFVLLSRVLVMDPSAKAFNGEKHSEVGSAGKLADLCDRLGTTLCAVRFKSDDIADEIVWQQLRRLMGSANAELSKVGFAPLLSLMEIEGTDAVLGFMINDGRRRYKVLAGPSALMKEPARAFALAHAHQSVIFRSLENDRLFVVEKSDCETPAEAVKWVLGKKVSIPSHLMKGMKIYDGKIPEDCAKLLYRAYVRKTTL
jgi:tRNA nucleotidyltransferase (CCA-adding enzyme)